MSTLVMRRVREVYIAKQYGIIKVLLPKMVNIAVCWLFLACLHVCLSFYWPSAPFRLVAELKNRNLFLHESENANVGSTSKQIESILNQAVALASKISLTNSANAIENDVIVLQPTKLSFSSSYTQKIVFNSSEKAVKYLGLPVSEYSLLDSQFVSKSIDTESGDSIFHLQLPLSDFTTAIEIITNASPFATSTPKKLLGLTSIRVTSQPQEGFIRMQSGLVYLQTVPVETLSHDDMEDFSDVYTSENYTISGDSQIVHDRQQLHYGATETNSTNTDNSSNSSLPVWLVWSSQEDNPTDKKMSVQPAVSIQLKWSPPHEQPRSPSTSFSLPKLFAQNADLDQLVVTAKVQVKVESNVPMHPALAAGLSFLPIKLLIQQAGSLILSVIVKTMAPMFVDLLLKDYYKRKL